MAENTSESKNNAFGKANDDWAKHLRKPGKKINNKQNRRASDADVKQQKNDMKEACMRPSHKNCSKCNTNGTNHSSGVCRTCRGIPAAKPKDSAPKQSDTQPKNEAIDYDDLDDRYDTKPGAGGKLNKKGERKFAPVGSNAAQQRHDLPRKNRLDKVRNTMKEIGAPITEGPPMMTREEAKAWLQERVSKNKGKESLEQRKKRALQAYHARQLGQKEGVDESQGDLFGDAPETKKEPAKAVAPKPAAPKAAPAPVVKKAPTAPTAPKPAAPTASVTKTVVKPEPQAGLDSTTPKAGTATTISKVVGPAKPAAPVASTAKQHGPDPRHKAPAAVDLSSEKAKAAERAAKRAGALLPGSKEADDAIASVKATVDSDAKTKRNAEKTLRNKALGKTESVVNELSPKTMKSYIKQAGNDRSDADFHAGVTANKPPHKKVGAVADRFDSASQEDALDRAAKRSKGIDRAVDKLTKEDVIDEISTTSGAGGYETPGAFAGKSHTAAQLKKKEVFGYKLLPAGKKEFYRDGDKLESIVPEYTANMRSLAESIEVAVKEYKKPHQQIGQAVQQIHRQLAQIEKCVALAVKTKTEGKVANTDLWKRTFKHLVKLDSRLTNLAREIREIRT